MESSFAPIFRRGFIKDLVHEINEDNISMGAAALSYYLLFALFPALIFFLSLLPYLPIQDLHGQVMGLIKEFLPGEAAATIEATIGEITQQRRGGVLSFGALLTLWAASSGLHAIMQELDVTYGVREGRPFWKARGIAVLLTIAFGLMVIVAFATIIFGGLIQSWLVARIGFGIPAQIGFTVFRYAVLLLMVIGTFSLIYHFGPDVKQKFRFFSPGALIGTALLLVASLVFKFYVENFANYTASYGSLGAVIILMLWLYVAGVVILLGSEINSMVETYHRDRNLDYPQGVYTLQEAVKEKKNAVVRKASWFEMIFAIVALFMTYRLNRSLAKKNSPRRILGFGQS
ncbi:MAG TPA: YihY/virulence factor BrkB family protein [Bdellovibrionales bacterium]|nr:YihY/virulence factor BrkB family protein [Bdellovibrionales bacterium]